MKTSLLIFFTVIFVVSCKQRNIEVITPASTLDEKVSLGKKIFFDNSLSNPVGQSCSSCHSPQTAFSDPNHAEFSEGAVKGLFTNRNAPALKYVKYIAPLEYSMDPDEKDINDPEKLYFGGLFLDGRVNTLEIQATKPFMNPLEMNNLDAEMLFSKLKLASYYGSFLKIYGEITDANLAVVKIADALAAFERSSEFNSFSSRFDLYLEGKGNLNEQELNGLKLFNDTLKANCSNCHISNKDEGSNKVMFTDFSYDNIGIPKNQNSPFLYLSNKFNPIGASFIDLGLGVISKDSHQDGKFRVPTLRNIAVTAPYGHNGFFKSLEEIVHFYNKKNIERKADPEVPQNENNVELGNLKLTAQEEKDIVAFLKTLTDQ